MSMCGFSSLENENWGNHKYSNGEGNMTVELWWQKAGKGCADNSNGQAGFL